MIDRLDKSAWEPLRRGAVGLAIVAGHAALILLIAQSRLTEARPIASVPVEATFIEEAPRQPDSSRLQDPVLSRVQPVQIVPPEVDIPQEPASTAITVNVEVPPPAPAVTTDQHGTGPAVPAMSTVAYLEQPSPRYPAESRRAREEGLVILRVLVDERGRVRSVDIYRSSGHPRLDDAARNAVGRALFKPYVDGGVARAATATIPIEFSLRSSS